MYICKKCNNVTEFEEINVVKTYIGQNELGICNHYVSDEFFYREDVICLNCESTMEDGDVQEINYDGYLPKQRDVLEQISNYCDCDCGNSSNCAEDECVIYRVEKLITNNL